MKTKIVSATSSFLVKVELWAQNSCPDQLLAVQKDNFKLYQGNCHKVLPLTITYYNIQNAINSWDSMNINSHDPNTKSPRTNKVK